jgi:hypothetical protein
LVKWGRDSSLFCREGHLFLFGNLRSSLFALPLDLRDWEFARNDEQDELSCFDTKIYSTWLTRAWEIVEMMILPFVIYLSLIRTMRAARQCIDAIIAVLSSRTELD